MREIMYALDEYPELQTVYTIVIAVCTFLGFSFCLGVVIDIVKTVVYKAKGKEYTWETPIFLTKRSSLNTCILMAVGILLGLYFFFSFVILFSSDDNIGKTCASCSEKVPAKYGIVIDDEFFCPECAVQLVRAESYRELQALENVLDESIILEKSECSWCGNPAPSGLIAQNEEHYCISCVTEALQNDNVFSAFMRFLEYGY